jgi:hypothetical protein
MAEFKLSVAFLIVSRTRSLKASTLSRLTNSARGFAAAQCGKAPTFRPALYSFMRLRLMSRRRSLQEVLGDLR